MKLSAFYDGNDDGGLPLLNHDSIGSSSSKERRFNGKSIQILLLWLGSKARIRRILALYVFAISLGLRWSALYLVDLTAIETLVPLTAPNANIQSWTMPNTTKQALQKDLLTLQWNDKDSVLSMKEFVAQAKHIVRQHLKGTELLKRSLRDLVDKNGPTDAIVLNNLPMDPVIPATPTNGSVTLDKSTFVAEAILLAVGELGGTHTFGYKSETHYSNPWVHEGFPRQGKGSALTATNHVPHHQDMSYQSVIPDLLGLICVREGQDHNVQTTLLDSAVVVEHLSDDVVEILRQPRFRIAAPLEWVDAENVDLTTLRPLLEGRSLHLPVDWNNMIGTDDEATRAINMLKEALQEVDPVGIHLEDGMMVLFNNQKVIHARTPYRQLRFDGTDRVIYRSYFSKRLGESAQETRII